ncbi:MAG: hypothetical protein Q8N56_02085 [bacterium]|nr:hypothetical protein [bacterium]
MSKVKLRIKNVQIEIEIPSLFPGASFRSIFKTCRKLPVFLVILALLFLYLPNPLKNIAKNSLLENLKPKPILATYQFIPVSGNRVVGTEQTITSATAAAIEGVNVGSWKGTLADDNFHWVVAGLDPGGVDVQLNVGNVQLNGANKLIIQTEIDLDATVLSTLVQICDWVSSTNVDTAADAQCTTGGWRTLNTKNASQAAINYTDTATDALQWHIYNGYWSTGTTGGTPISTPLSNFVNGSNQIKIRYYSATASVSTIAIDYLRIYAVIDPIYQAGEFVNQGTGTPAGTYHNSVVVGNTATAVLAQAGDAIYLSVPGTASTISDFYLKFKNIKTYTGMNTVLVNTDSLCSAATVNLRYRFAVRNFTLSSWEDISNWIDCYATSVINTFAKNNVTISNYINGSNEIWIRVYANNNSTTSLQLDTIYLTLGTTNTDAASAEIPFGSNIAGRIAENPSRPYADRIQAMTMDSTYMYVAGYDSIGIDNEWRMEKRNLSDGALVTAFDTDGIVTNDPSTGADQIFAIASTSDAIFIAGYDLAAGAGQWRIEKRDITTGALMTAFDTDGIIQYNPNTDVDQITAIAVDASYLYVTGFEDDDTGVWRIHKYDITTGALVTAFDTDGIITETLAAIGDERPQAISVDADYLYAAGYASISGESIGWRIEKRNKTSGALCDGVGNCAAGAFDTDGIIEVDNNVLDFDGAYALVVDGNDLFVVGEQAESGVAAGDIGQWRIEKRSATTGALDLGFDTDGIVVSDKSADNNRATAIVDDATYIYVAGYTDDDAGAWSVEKRLRTTGALDTDFDADGIVFAEDGGDDSPQAIAVNGSSVYIVGYGTGPGDNQWLIEKRSISTGLRTTDSFGSNSVSDTRNIDTANNPSVWNIQTENESTTFSHDYYPLNTDADAVIEEAGAGLIPFSVTAPTNAAVTGIFFSGRLMAGAAGTVQLGLRDYSGLTGTVGGWSAIGSSPTIAIAYTDNLTVGGVGSGGLAGFMTNPEDHIDTVGNQMSLRLRTTVDGATTYNSTISWDFAMVSLQWIETAAPANQALTIGEVSLNSKGNINLLENSTVDIMASVSVTDTDGCADISEVKAIVYRYSSYTASCSNDPNNCYDEDLFNCVADGACVGNTQEYNCYASSSMQFFADPTDSGSSFSADEWVVTVIASDSYWADVSSSSYDDNDESDIEVNSLTAVEITAGSPINYGEVIAGQNTGAVNQTLTVKNTGNKGIDVMVYGTDLTGVCGTITVGNQQYTSSSFTYNDYGKTLLATPGERYYNGQISWIKPTSTTPITNNIYWGISVSEGTATGVCSGTNTFSATAEQ